MIAWGFVLIGICTATSGLKGGGEDDRMENAGSASAKDLRPP